MIFFLNIYVKPLREGCMLFKKESRMFNHWFNYIGLRHIHIWAIFMDGVYLVNVNYDDNRTDKVWFTSYHILAGRPGNMNGGHEKAITVPTTHPPYHDWLLSVTASFIILLEWRSSGHTVGFTAISWDGLESWRYHSSWHQKYQLYVSNRTMGISLNLSFPNGLIFHMWEFGPDS